MNMVNLAHGSLYMVGAYFAITVTQWSGSYLLGVLAGLVGTLIVGMVVEVVALRTLYQRDHLDQVLATFGLILFFNELVAILFGRFALFASLPSYLQGHIELFAGIRYPVYRAVVIRRRFVGSGPPVVRRDAHAAGHADPRRRLQPHHGGGARRQHPPALHAWCSASAPRSPASPA